MMRGRRGRKRRHDTLAALEELDACELARDYQGRIPRDSTRSKHGFNSRGADKDTIMNSSVRELVGGVPGLIR